MTASPPGLRVMVSVAIAAALQVVALGASAAAVTEVRFDTPAAAGALGCPPRPAVYPAAPTPSPSPPPGGLGSLAETVIRPPPRLEIPGLSRLAEASADRPFRIGWWGDSHVAAGPFPRTLSERLSAGGRTVAADWLPPTVGRANVRLSAVGEACIGPGWSSSLAFQAQGPVEVGPALISREAAGGADSWLALDFRTARRTTAPLRRLDIVYRAVAGARLSIAVNDAAPQAVPIAPGPGPDRIVVSNTAPIATLRIAVEAGPWALQGLRLDYVEPPAVVFDVFGLPGSTARGWANADPAWAADAAAGLGFDLVVLQYGTNESLADPALYEAEVRASIDHLRRAEPAAACLLVGPPDRGVRSDAPTADLDIWLRHSRAMGLAAEIQSRVAAERGCAFWDWRAMMGGEGGAYGWAFARPPLMGPDLTHLTPSGYRLSAEALAASLGF